MTDQEKQQLLDMIDKALVEHKDDDKGPANMLAHMASCPQCANLLALLANYGVYDVAAARLKKEIAKTGDMQKGVEAFMDVMDAAEEFLRKLLVVTYLADPQAFRYASTNQAFLEHACDCKYESQKGAKHHDDEQVQGLGGQVDPPEQAEGRTDA